jgi:hypothetical protein
MSDAPQIPSIPSLGSIVDPDTQRALAAIKNILEVRNGDVGSGDHAFITRADLEAMVKDGFSSITNNYSLGNGASTSGDGTSTSTTPPGQGTANLGNISLLQDAVANSPLFLDLGKRIKLLDTPGTGVIAKVGRAQIGLAKESTQRLNNDNAIIAAINTMWGVVGNASSLIQSGQIVTVNQTAADATSWLQLQASVGGVSTAIREESTARANADRSLFAQYSVKIDQNGYVAGFGLSSETSTAGATTSQFIVRADRFSIGSPQGPTSAAPVIPFIVQTTPTNINGKYVAPGVYMDTAMIRYGSIGTAQIGVAQIDTLTVAGNAITVPSTTYVAPSGVVLTRQSSPFSSFQTIGSLTVDFGAYAPSMVVVFGSVNLLTVAGPTGVATLYLRVRETTTNQTTSAAGQVSSNSLNFVLVGALSGIGSGVRTFVLEVTRDNSGFDFSVGDVTLTTLGAKR